MCFVVFFVVFVWVVFSFFFFGGGGGGGGGFVVDELIRQADIFAWMYMLPTWTDHLAGLVVIRCLNPDCDGIFPGRVIPVTVSDLKTGTPVATLPGAWLYRVSSGTGRPGVSIV